jgi:hypothetical protein
METFGAEFGVVDFIRLMKAYLDRQIDARTYQRRYFDLTVQRVNIPNEDVSRITQQDYGDADDYEPDDALRQTNPQWVGKLQLRQRVAKSLRDLEALGYRLED